MFVLLASVLLVIAGMQVTGWVLKLLCVGTGLYGCVFMLIGIVHALEHASRSI